MITTLSAIGSPRNPVWFVMQRMLVSLIAIVCYGVLLHSGLDAQYAILAGIVVMFLAQKLRRSTRTQSLNAQRDDLGKVGLYGDFAERGVPASKRIKLVSVELSGDRLWLDCLENDEPKRYSLDRSSFRPESLQTISTVLSALIARRDDFDALPDAGVLRIYVVAERRILHFHQKPSYIRLTWVSLGAAVAVLYAGIRLIQV